MYYVCVADMDLPRKLLKLMWSSQDHPTTSEKHCFLSGITFTLKRPTILDYHSTANYVAIDEDFENLADAPAVRNIMPIMPSTIDDDFETPAIYSTCRKHYD